MKIGIIGAGNIGKTLAIKLAKAGHNVKVANSRGPETIDAETLKTGALAVTTEEAFQNVEVVILSIPFIRNPEMASYVLKLPKETLIIDTSNYYPLRDGKIEEIELGKVESQWVSEKIGRTTVKAWNSIVADSFKNLGLPAGDPKRIALPIAADKKEDYNIAMRLMEETGFDAYYSGPISESWRQQPGAPAYCTDQSISQLPLELSRAKKNRLARKRDLAMEVIGERMDNGDSFPSGDYIVRLNRIIYM